LRNLVWMTLVAAPLLGVAARLVWLYVHQRSIIYDRGVLTRSALEARIKHSFQGKAQELSPFDALVIEPEASAIKGTAVWFHGNGGIAADRAHFVPVFASRGIRLVLAEYPGHAARAGAPSEQSLVKDALALYAHLHARYPGPIWLIGESLGTGIATQVAAQSPLKPERLVLLTPFLSLAEAAAQRYPWVPVRLILRDLFDSARHLPKYSGPVSILIAQLDEVIHPRQARTLSRIARRCGADIRVLEIENATHSGWCSLIGENEWSYLLGASPVQTGA
jgi:uncharacterized protein